MNNNAGAMQLLHSTEHTHTHTSVHWQYTQASPQTEHTHPTKEPYDYSTFRNMEDALQKGRERKTDGNSHSKSTQSEKQTLLLSCCCLFFPLHLLWRSGLWADTRTADASSRSVYFPLVPCTSFSPPVEKEGSAMPLFWFLITISFDTQMLVVFGRDASCGGNKACEAASGACRSTEQRENLLYPD